MDRSIADMIPQMPDSIAQSTCAGFLAALASKEPTPGGGAVAGLIGATATALGEMVSEYSLGRSEDPSIEQAITGIKSELSRARVLFLKLADEDAVAYAELNSAFKMPKSDPERKNAIRAGAAVAMMPPQAALATASDVARLLERLLPVSNRNLVSDLGIASDLILSAANAAYWNIRANAPMLGDDGASMLLDAERSLSEIAKWSGFVESGCFTIAG
jgi:formiminotetrahydrofolate cyclodeaminase